MLTLVVELLKMYLRISDIREIRIWDSWDTQDIQDISACDGLKREFDNRWFSEMLTPKAANIRILCRSNVWDLGALTIYQIFKREGIFETSETFELVMAGEQMGPSTTDVLTSPPKYSLSDWVSRHQWATVQEISHPSEINCRMQKALHGRVRDSLGPGGSNFTCIYGGDLLETIKSLFLSSRDRPQTRTTSSGLLSFPQLPIHRWPQHPSTGNWGHRWSCMEIGWGGEFSRNHQVTGFQMTVLKLVQEGRVDRCLKDYACQASW